MWVLHCPEHSGRLRRVVLRSSGPAHGRDDARSDPRVPTHAEAGRAIGGAGDEGIDGIISEDRLGLDTIYIQAKRWEGTVGRPEIQKFVEALHGKRARKGVFITTGSFSADAREYVSHIDPRVVLIDGRELSEYMHDLSLGVTTEVKRVDSDYFSEE